MPPDFCWWGTGASRMADWEPFAVPTRLSSGQHSLDLTVWPSRGNADGACGASVPAPAWRALRVCAVGTSLLGHDVSGTGRQTVGRMMLSIITMVPRHNPPPTEYRVQLTVRGKFESPASAADMKRRSLLEVGTERCEREPTWRARPIQSRTLMPNGAGF
jgi:hypothetical protein